MSYGTQLRTETSQPITPDSINKDLSEMYIRRRSSERWDGLTHTFTTREARLRNFNGNWPHSTSPCLTPAALHEAGVFYSGI
jgi:hypothetical protein